MARVETRADARLKRDLTACFEREQANCVKALVNGFALPLAREFPATWGSRSFKQNWTGACADLAGMKADLETATNYVFDGFRASTPSRALLARAVALDAEHKVDVGTKHSCWHGASSAASAKDIAKHGLKTAEFGSRFTYGKGGYVSPSASVALFHAAPDAGACRYIVYGAAQLGDVKQAAVGAPGQEDFGAYRNGRPRLSLKSPCGQSWCLQHDAQYVPLGSVRFKVGDKRPGDAALTYMWFPEDVWEDFKRTWPDTAARSAALRQEYKLAQRTLRPRR